MRLHGLFLLVATVGWATLVSGAQARFLQRDPIGYEDDQNVYAYVYNDPLNLSDPTGKNGLFDAFQIFVTPHDQANDDHEGGPINSHRSVSNETNIVGVGVSGSVSAVGGQASGSVSIGVAANRSEVRGFVSYGGSLTGTTETKPSASAQGGLVVGHHNGTPEDTAGAFTHDTVTVAAGMGGTVDVVHGQSADGQYPVTGATVTIGPGEGASGGRGISNTIVTPPVKLQDDDHPH